MLHTYTSIKIIIKYRQAHNFTEKSVEIVTLTTALVIWNQTKHLHEIIKIIYLSRIVYLKATLDFIITFLRNVICKLN